MPKHAKSRMSDDGLKQLRLRGAEDELNDTKSNVNDEKRNSMHDSPRNTTEGPRYAKDFDSNDVPKCRESEMSNRDLIQTKLRRNASTPKQAQFGIARDAPKQAHPNNDVMEFDLDELRGDRGAPE